MEMAVQWFFFFFFSCKDKRRIIMIVSTKKKDSKRQHKDFVSFTAYISVCILYIHTCILFCTFLNETYTKLSVWTAI